MGFEGVFAKVPYSTVDRDTQEEKWIEAFNKTSHRTL